MKTFTTLVAALMFVTSCGCAVRTVSVSSEPPDADVLERVIPKSLPADVSPGADPNYVPRIVLDGEVGGDSVAQVMALMQMVTENGAKAIVLEMNTPGGSVNDGFRLARAMEESPIPVICVVDGEAASMGFYLLQSCSLRLMTKRSALMAHEPAVYGQFGGHPQEWQSMADMLKAMTVAMVEHMVHRMSVTPEQMMAKIVGGQMWWFTWQEALDTHAVDGVASSVGEVCSSYRDHMKPPQLITQ